MVDRPTHPSGRAIHKSEPRKMSVVRNPGKGPETPRLRDPERVNLIGFHHIRPAADEDDE